MHKLLIALVLVLNCGVFGASHWYFTNNPRQTLVIIDSSFSMSQQWRLVNPSIEEIDSKHRYDQLYLATDKADIGIISPPQIKLQIPYGTRDLQQAANKYSHLKSWRSYMITNADQIPSPFKRVLAQ